RSIQADPLSLLLLYVIAFKPLLRVLNKKLNGISIKDIPLRSIAYTDNLIVELDSIESWETFRALINLYKLASNAQINKNKTSISDFTTRIKKLTEDLVQRNLSFKGKILVANSIMIAKIWYVKNLEGRIMNETSNWLWNLNEIWLHKLESSQKSIKDTNLLARSQVGPKQKERYSLETHAQVLTIWIYTGNAKLEKCPACSDNAQTIEHLSINCHISHLMWNVAYSFFNGTNLRTPETFEEIVTTLNISKPGKGTAALWIHITAIYEIWWWYSQMIWGKKIPEPLLPYILKSKEVKVLRNRGPQNKEVEEILKQINTFDHKYDSRCKHM
ncbi:1636_t:CDS:2, partial [Gigaspora rosea]